MPASLNEAVKAPNRLKPRTSAKKASPLSAAAIFASGIVCLAKSAKSGRDSSGFAVRRAAGLRRIPCLSSSLATRQRHLGRLPIAVRRAPWQAAAVAGSRATPGRVFPFDGVAGTPSVPVHHFGVGTVSILPSEWMIVLVPLPLGTTTAEPPPGSVSVW